MQRIWVRPTVVGLVLAACNVAIIEVLRRSPPTSGDTLVGIIISIVMLGFQAHETIAAERRAVEASASEQEWKSKAESFLATAREHVDVARNAATATRRAVLLDQFSVLTRTWIDLNVQILAKQPRGPFRMTAADAAEGAAKAREVALLAAQRGAVATACRGLLDQLSSDGADVRAMERLYEALDHMEDRPSELRA